MNTLCYVRQGRRFVPVPNYVGYFYGNDGFQKEKTARSYAIVVSQDVNVVTLAHLDRSINRMSWHKANGYCTSIRNAYMPSLIEILQATKFKEHLLFKDFDTEWTSTTLLTGSARYLLWTSYEYDTGVDGKCWEHYVRPFFKLDVLTRKRIPRYVQENR